MKPLRLKRDIGVAPWWRQRSGRERILLVVLAAAAVGYLALTAGVRPLLAGRDAARAEIRRSDNAIARLAALPPPGEAPAVAVSTEPVTAIVTETAAAAAIPIRRIEPSADGARLTIEDAPFVNVLAWIDALETGQGLRLVSLEMERRPEPGVVSATLSLQR